MKLYNFSHPLTQQQLDDIAVSRDISTGDIEIVNLKVQLDLNAPLRAQMSDIADQVKFKLGEDIYVMLPGQSPAAVILTDLLQSHCALRSAEYADWDDISI